MAAPLLRELIMGDPPLMHAVNRERRLRIRFEVGRATAYQQAVLADQPVFYARGDGLYPGTALVSSTTESLNLDEFLREMVMIVQGHAITVRDLIDYIANAAGAVHFGDPQKDKRAILAAIDQQLVIGGVAAPLQSVLAVGRIVVDALDPLVKMIEADAVR